MIKRLVPLCLAAVVLVLSLAVPSYAAESNNDVGINILDYSTVDESGSNYFNFANSTSIYIDVPGSYYATYIDIVFNVASGPAPTSVQSVWSGSTVNELTVVNIGRGYYRAYGYIRVSTYYSLTLNFSTGSTGRTYIELLSCRLTGNWSHFDIESYCTISSVGFNDTIHYIPTDDINYRLFNGPSDYINSAYSLFLWAPDWAKYDYIDFRLQISASSIDSVACHFGSVDVPIEVSTVLSSIGNYMDYWLNVRVDLTGLDRTSTTVPQLQVSGKLNLSDSNYINVLSTSGFLKITPADKLFLYFADLKYNLSSLFNSLQTWILNQTNSIVSALNGDQTSGNQFKDDTSDLIDDLGDISSDINSVTRPVMSDIDADFSADISDSTVLLGSLFSEVNEIQWLARLILASVTMGLIAYILYGKE